MASDWNIEHYRDPTANAAIRDEAREMWRAKAKKAIFAAKAALKAHGFEAVGRISIRDRKSGKLY
ncbi:hypothetical protein [Selenomonas ruminantium]|uniref:Uncharacterized protein n=1 Tax=Selenomonas ruminantium TaxID=971 RepID=A0A1H0MZM6_SELRU|nr:hypothetical protein [Selenomonas ruminantium]SDO85716.1 hypothetical protein SAMN05216366_102105 [Selenomonas ruminantium]